MDFIGGSMERTRSPRSGSPLRRGLPPLAALLLGPACWAISGCDRAVVADPPASVVLFVFDAARADHFGFAGHSRPTTPHVDAFARESLRHSTVVSEAPFTFLAMASLMTGQSPADSGLSARSGGRIADSARMLAEVARERGFATHAYSENPYVTRYFGFHQGFDHFEEAFPVTLLEQGRELASDHDTAAQLEAALDRATRRETPFFLYVHLLRPHNPYDPPPPFAGRFGSGRDRHGAGSTAELLGLDARGPPFDRASVEDLIARYDENLAYADALFGGFLESLERRGIAERTLVVLTSDHGEAFGEHGRLLHSTQLYEPMLRVPLIVRIPGEPPRVDDHPIQLADLGRGLRDYFLAANGPEAFRALQSLGRDRAAEAPLFSWTNAKSHHVAARTPARKLVVDAQTLDVVAHLDLGADPGESRPLPLDGHGLRLRDLVIGKIESWTGVATDRADRIPPVAAGPPAPGEADEAEHGAAGGFDRALRARLEALGYVGDRSID